MIVPTGSMGFVVDPKNCDWPDPHPPHLWCLLNTTIYADIKSCPGKNQSWMSVTAGE